MTEPVPDSPPPAAFALVGRVAAALPSLTVSQLDELAGAVEALTDAIGIRLDWSAERAEDAAPARCSGGYVALSDAELARRREPSDTGDERADLVAWLAYQRHEFGRKLRDLSADQLVDQAVPPVQLSVLGLVRHMRQMEAAYLGWGLSGEGAREIYGEDDFPGGSVETIDEDLAGWRAEIQRSDAAIAALRSLDDVGLGHGRSLRWTLFKMVHEYTLHAGEAHMIRFAALGELIR
jgi:hypothetical protein